MNLICEQSINCRLWAEFSLLAAATTGGFGLLLALF